MVQSIMRDIEFLKKPSAPACPSDAPVADDLCDTLRAHIEGCVGMAANMIGAYEAEEGCLSLTGTRKAKRYRTIKVQWQTRDGKLRVKNYSGFTAQIIQHEIDHLEGIII